MLNATVRAAATGLPSLNRRLFLSRTSATAFALALPVAAVAHQPDPIFAAIAKATEAAAAFEETCSQLSAAEAAVLALGLGYQAHVEFAAATIYSHENLRKAFDVERTRFPMMGEKLQLAEDKLHAELDRKAAAIRSVEVAHGYDELERREASDSAATIAAEIDALSTVPKTLAGMAALADFMCLQRIADSDNAKLGAASLAAACRNLIPA